MDRVGTVVPQCILRLEATGVHHLAALSVKISYEFQQAHRSNRFRLVWGGQGFAIARCKQAAPSRSLICFLDGGAPWSIYCVIVFFLRP